MIPLSTGFCRNFWEGWCHSNCCLLSNVCFLCLLLGFSFCCWCAAVSPQVCIGVNLILFILFENHCSSLPVSMSSFNNSGKVSAIITQNIFSLTVSLPGTLIRCIVNILFLIFLIFLAISNLVFNPLVMFFNKLFLYLYKIKMVL